MATSYAMDAAEVPPMSSYRMVGSDTRPLSGTFVRR
jgi:hypothetical protein